MRDVCIIKIRFNCNQTTGKIIQWSDRAKNKPIRLITFCPYCSSKQLINISDLYRGKNGTMNNYQCTNCGQGTLPLLKADQIKYYKNYPNKYASLKPRNPGWKSIGFLKF